MRNPLPPTVNLHIVGHCNFKCRYCYARFEKAKTFLPLEVAEDVLKALPGHGVTRVTFAGGEPTLHPNLLQMLESASRAGLATALVTNGSFDRDAARRLFPWLRWLVLSVDSDRRETNDRLGRRFKGNDRLGQVSRAEQLARWLHEWNSVRPRREHVRLKVNVVVNALNADEDPASWLEALKPERIKLLQCRLVPGENDDASALAIADDAFARYARRLERLDDSGIIVVAERAQDIVESYAMIDPRGRFRQSSNEGYRESRPIQDVGLAPAWDEVGGCDLNVFRARGGEYDGGLPASGVTSPIIALEGLDGVGKSTAVRELAARLNAAVVTNPPAALANDRARADALPADERRAWYREANRAAMSEATEHVFAGRAVVMDRSFATTEVYAAAEQDRVASRKDMPSARPDAVFLIDIDEAQRQRRLASRDSGRTHEEKRLDVDHAFRERVLSGYAALGVIAIDGSGPVAATIDAIMKAIRAKG